MIVIVGTIRIFSHEDKERMLVQMREMGDATRAEPGAVEYRSSLDLFDPLLFHILEVWKTEDDVKAHNTSAHMKKLIENTSDIKTEISLRAYEGGLVSYDLGRLVHADTYADESGKTGMSISME